RNSCLTCALRNLPSFPTRRSSDLVGPFAALEHGCANVRARVRASGVVGFLNAGDERSARTKRRACSSSHPRGEEMSGISLDSTRSEEHTSELQSRENLVCRLLLEK